MVVVRCIHILVVDLLILSPLISPSYAISKEYKIIDGLLDRKEQGSDVGDNTKWIDELLSQRDCQAFSCFSSPKKSLYRSLGDLVELYHKSQGAEKCSNETLTLLRKAKKNTGFYSDWSLYDRQKSKISYRVRQIGLSIANQCSEAKERALPVRLQSLDENEMRIFNAHMEHYEQTLEDGVRGYAAGDTPEMLLRYVITKYLHTDPTEALTARETIKKIAEDEVKVNKPYKEVSRRKLDEFVKEYFLKPCNYYIRHTRDIIDPLLEYVNFRDEPESLYSSHVDFYKAIGRFNWCHNMHEGHKRIFDKPKRGPRVQLKSKSS